MVLVLSLLALIALVGLALVARTHTDSRRVVAQSDATSVEDAMNGVIRAVSDRLYQDIWGAITDPTILPATVNFAVPLNNMTPPGGLPTDVNYFGILENNEPWDHEGEADPWLASLLPYYVGDLAVLDPNGNGTTTIIEPGVYAYNWVSYIGQDLLLPPATSSFLGSPFMWADNARNPNGPRPLQYQIGGPTTQSALGNIPILLTPAPGPNSSNPNIAGSTTNQTIRSARANWLTNHLPWLENTANTGLPAGLRPQFPYFDTNRDGMPDLYDADGDGIPDSPLSLVIPIDSDDANRKRTLYAAVRIVDNNAMINLNAASSLRRAGSDTLTFDGTSAGQTRRGRRATEVLIDGAVHTSDWLALNRVGNTTARRVAGVTNPELYDNDVVRRLLLGGQYDLNTYFPFDLDDESSLKHRGRLVRYDRQVDRTIVTNDYTNIDRGLLNTSQWSRQIFSNWPANYTGAPRWQRLNSTQESYDNADGVGWRRIIDEADPAFVRRPLLTTMNGEVRVPPDITRPTMSTAPVLTPLPDTQRATAQFDIDERVRLLWSLGMNWPVLIEENSTLADVIATEAPLTGPTADSVFNGSLIDRFIVPVGQMPPEWARVMPVDLNMTFGGNVTDQNVRDVKAEFVRYAAAAMYFALDNVQFIQGIDLRANGGLMREYFAWQFALNLADYRDADSIPTTIQWPTQPNIRITGVERQPFFTEALAYLQAGAPPLSGPATGPGSGQSDKWFFAVELFIPPGWSVDSANLYLRSPNTAMGLRPLANFLNHQSGGSLASVNAGLMNGGPAEFVDPGDGDHGEYYVFTGPTTHEPPSLAADDINYRNAAFADSQFRIATDGRGRVELVYSRSGVENDPTNVVLDVIGPDFAGGPLASSTPNGVGRWAFRDPSMPENAQRAFSLRRSTKGWRFTTAWHAYSEAPSNAPGAPTFNMSLGRPNNPLPQLADKIPESIWPSITPYGVNAALIDTFASGQPFDAFDSVADLSRHFLIGPVNQSVSPILTSAFANLGIGLTNAPTTLVLAEILQSPVTGDLPGTPEERVAAGRIDFFNARKISNSTNAPAWTWRLFDYVVSSSHMYDGVDNDGDGQWDLNDPTEAWDVLYKEVGHINMHTAPATVLRAIPSMSTLPNSPELMTQYAPNPPITDQLAAYANASLGEYYDYAAPIVALREGRDVPIRLFDSSTSTLRVVAAAQVAPSGPSIGPGATNQRTSRRDGAFYGPVELSRLRGGKVSEIVNGANEMFAINRLDSESVLPLTADHHLAPDYRVRPLRGVSDYVALRGATQPIVGFAGTDPTGVETDPMDAGGIRGRDIYLSRMSNLLTTRSDVFTAYIALIDEDGNYVRRTQLTLDRSPCFRDSGRFGGEGRPAAPTVVLREDGSYSNDLK